MAIFQKQKVIGRVVLLPVETIVPNPAQPRRTFNPEELKSLAESIRQNGLLQPISVRRKAENRYELIAGERRLRACKLCGKAEIPAIIEELSDTSSAVLALIENLQRSQLNYFEEAAAIRALIDRCHLTQEQAASRLGKSQSSVANKLRLLKYSPELQLYMLESGLTERHARALLKLEDETIQRQAIQAIREKNLNVSQTEAYLEILQRAKPQRGPTRLVIVKDVKIFCNTIEKAVDLMKQSGINAVSEQIEQADCIEYVIKISKDSLYRSPQKSRA